MIKTLKSSAEIQTEAALIHFEIIISKQLVRVEDAQYISNTVAKLLEKCEELRKSRDKWRIRAETAEEKLK